TPRFVRGSWVGATIAPEIDTGPMAGCRTGRASVLPGSLLLTRLLQFPLSYWTQELAILLSPSFHRQVFQPFSPPPPWLPVFPSSPRSACLPLPLDIHAIVLHKHRSRGCGEPHRFAVDTWRFRATCST